MRPGPSDNKESTRPPDPRCGSEGVGQGVGGCRDDENGAETEQQRRCEAIERERERLCPCPPVRRETGGRGRAEDGLLELTNWATDATEIQNKNLCARCRSSPKQLPRGGGAGGGRGPLCAQLLLMLLLCAQLLLMLLHPPGLSGLSVLRG
ncbi:unnamed protein product [Lampetra planeri]